MEIKKHTIVLITILSGASLLGLLTLQAYLIKNTADQEENTFRQSVAAALTAVSVSLETGETLHNVFMFTYADSLENGPPSKIAGGNGARFWTQAHKQVRVGLVDVNGRIDTVLVDTVESSEGLVRMKDSTRSLRRAYAYSYTTDSNKVILQIEQTPGSNARISASAMVNREDLVKRVVKRLAQGEHVPVTERLQPATLDSLLHQSLTEAGVDLPYAFGILSVANDSLVLARPAVNAADLVHSGFRTRLFPTDVFALRNDLVVYFPDRTMYLLRRVAPMLAASVFFSFIIVFGFVHTIRTVFKQKRFAGMMVDFITNMTHEFKTPISTIALACEAIARPDVLSHPEKVTRYNSIILEENSRMRKQAEKILQLAILENGDYELHLGPVDVHEVLEQAIRNTSLVVEERAGALKHDLRASMHSIEADPVHFANIVHNILDNANKYSPEQPSISVSTFNEGEELVIVVRDAGIGMEAEHLKQVFEKYYRVPTGNLHNVKGFGLGLSYVKLMVEAHRGSISLRSLPGEGTTVELRFPVSKTSQAG